MTNYITTFEPLVRLSGLSLIRSFAEQPVLIGYMRVSKADGSQTFDLQRDALLAAGVEPGHLYEDQASGRARQPAGSGSMPQGAAAERNASGVEARPARLRPAPSGQSRP